MTTNWNKYTYVCPNCDGLVEITIQSNTAPNPLCTEDAGFLTLLSVADATIQPTTTEEEQMETATVDTSSQESMSANYNNYANMIVKDTRQQEMTYTSVTPYDVNCLFTDNDYIKKINKKFESAVSTVKDILLESFVDSDDQDTLRSIADALNIQLTKTIEWSATMYVSGSMEVDLFDEFDLDAELSDSLQVSAWSGDIEVEDYSVEDARES
jgi:hypothetical protein